MAQPTAVVQIIVSPEEHRVIRMAAAASGQTMSKFGRDVLLAAVETTLAQEGVSFFASPDSRENQDDSFNPSLPAA